MSLFSLNFIVFLLIIVFIYYLIPKKYQWTILLGASYFFYIFAGGGIKALFYLVAITLISYLYGVHYHKKSDGNKNGKAKENGILILCIALELLILWYVKYINFTIEQLNILLKLFGNKSSFNYINLLLPIGISFYTFQTIGYMIDISKRKAEAETNLFKYALFVSFFPQIVQGPISRFKNLHHQFFAEHSFDYQTVKFGAQRMLWGYIKKMVIADRIAIVVNQVFNNYQEQNYIGFTIFIAVILYGFQIFADFSGGIDIIIGIAEMLDIKMPENFNQPFFAKSVSEFWQRWHMTLGDWMRDYVFYPLALSRPFKNLGKSMRKHFGNNLGKVIAPSIASFIVFLLVGLWHGAAWKYIAYGLYQSFFVSTASLFEKQYAKVRQLLKINENALSFTLFRILRTNIIITFGRYLSRGSSLTSAIEMWKLTFSKYNPWVLFDNSLFELGLNDKNFYFMVLSIIILIIIEFLHEKGIHIRQWIAKQDIIARWSIYFLALFTLIIFGVYGTGFNAGNLIYQGF